MIMRKKYIAIMMAVLTLAVSSCDFLSLTDPDSFDDT